MTIRWMLHVIRFAFHFPKYKTGDTVVMWEKKRKLKRVYRDWGSACYMYVINKQLTVSEGLVDFYKEKE